MPIYEYQCGNCGFIFEIMQRISDSPPGECPKCSSEDVRKIISKVGFQLKGTGWYETDFKNNDKKTKKDSEGGKEKKVEKTQEKEKKSTKDTTEAKKSSG